MYPSRYGNRHFIKIFYIFSDLILSLALSKSRKGNTKKMNKRNKKTGGKDGRRHVTLSFYLATI